MHPLANVAAVSPDIMPFGWYAVYTRHQHEKSAASLLKRKGFEVLLPLYSSENRWSDRKQTVQLPLFPNYLFVQADLQRRVEVLRTPGVCWFVGGPSGPTNVSPDEMEIVERLVECPSLVEPYAFLECGSNVRVRSGPLAGLTGVLVRAKNRNRVIISLTTLQKSAAVEVGLENLDRIMPSYALPEAAGGSLPKSDLQPSQSVNSARGGNRLR